MKANLKQNFFVILYELLSAENMVAFKVVLVVLLLLLLMLMMVVVVAKLFELNLHVFSVEIIFLFNENRGFSFLQSELILSKWIFFFSSAQDTFCFLKASCLKTYDGSILNKTKYKMKWKRKKFLKQNTKLKGAK